MVYRYIQIYCYRNLHTNGEKKLSLLPMFEFVEDMLIGY